MKNFYNEAGEGFEKPLKPTTGSEFCLKMLVANSNLLITEICLVEYNKLTEQSLFNFLS